MTAKNENQGQNRSYNDMNNERHAAPRKASYREDGCSLNAEQAFKLAVLC